jgi:transposase
VTIAAPYPLELRRRIVRAYTHKQGSIRALAKRFSVAPNTVQNYLKLLRATGSLAPRPHSGGRKLRIPSRWLQEVRRLLREIPQATVAELAEAFAQRHPIEMSRSTMARAIQRARRDAERTITRERV